ncbi:MAG TPA: hypothetical protein VIL46_17535, partial [Gemmataceae bacterium]
LAAPAPLRAEPAPDPARFLPADTGLLVKVEQPRRLVESAVGLELIRDLYRLEPLRELADTTSARRALRLLRYFEQELGAPWPELLDRLAGGGVAIGVRYLTGSSPAVLVIQGTDPALAEKFQRLALELIESELARTEAKVQVERRTYEGVEGIRVGKNFFTARIDAALLVASSNAALKSAIDLHLAHSRGEKAESLAGAAGPRAARKVLPEGPLAWAWLNFAPLKALPQAKEVFARPRNDFNLTFLFGGWLDAARRSDFLTAGLYRTEGGFLTTVRLPAGRDTLPEEMALHVPPPGEPGTLPLLEPEGVLFSHSFYLDLKAMWDYRKLLMPEGVAKSFEEGVKQGSRFIPGGTLPKVFERSGVYHRFVAAAPRDAGYGTELLQKLPSFAFVTSMRDPAFVRTVEPLIRTGALAASTQFKLRMREEEYKGVKIVGYHFPEDRDLPGDVSKLRFNFSPCFAAAGDQFLVCSCVPFCKELIDEVRSASRAGSSPANMRMRFYAEGAKALLNAAPDQLVTQAVLDQAVPVGEAKERIAEFLTWLERAGTLTLETEHGADSFRFDIRWQYGK